jgi:cytosine/adenosine deaminase-related metal-dependent hydrolase
MPIDPLEGPRYALEGKVVTMDDNFHVLERGTVYIDAGQIVAVQPANAPAPPGFAGTPLVRTGGTIFPGLIELHNHLSYNALPLWQVPRLYTNRSQWGRHPDYRKLISGPMGVLGRTPGYPEAIVRYVECKCLLSGVTTSQGIALYSNSGMHRFYRGAVRNVEATRDPALPNASTRIADVDARDAARFLERLQTSSCLLLHLSEGVDERAQQHFKALRLENGTWAITPALVAIHAAALQPDDFNVVHDNGAAVIWSPMSNLLLYGDTANIRAAKESGVLMGIGSDWSPSGSKNLLGELKAARLVSEAMGGVFTDRELVAMATSNAARILKWQQALGSIEAGKRADLVVVNGRQGDPYARLLAARETSITLVVINGIPRYGQSRLMLPFGPGTEEWPVGSSRRTLNLAQASADPVVGELTLQAAQERLRDGLQRLAELARVLEDPATALSLVTAAADESGGPVWFLELDHHEPPGSAQRPHLPLAETGELTGLLAPVLGATPLSELLEPIELDPLTVVDDDRFFARLAHQPNLPDYIRSELPPMYGARPVLPQSAEFVTRLHPAVQPQFNAVVELATFRKTSGHLTQAERLLLVEQALVLLEQTYVHLPLKRAMHAVDPVQRLRLLKYRLEKTPLDQLPPEIEFHQEMTAIFTSTRDLHTNYLLPTPYREKTAFLPFMIEEYYVDDEPQYLVSKVVGDIGPESFREGVEVLHWNGIPIRQAVAINAERQAGSNAEARRARGLDALTIRPLVRVRLPDEDWVTLRYRTAAGEVEEITQPWLLFSPQSASSSVNPDAGTVEAAVLGFDVQTDAIHQVKKILLAPEAVAAEQHIAETQIDRAAPPQGLATTMPTIFRARKLDTPYGVFGHIRIFSFNVHDADAFVQEFVRLVASLPQNGLIIDVRGNGGGLIYAAEQLLQVLTARRIEPERAQFVNSPLILDICRLHARSSLLPGFNLEEWKDSVAQAVETGATYSRTFPITPEAACNGVGQQYYGPVVLITDALCYSATDIFAAGFQDHEIGPILGVHQNTGAGGANVWTHHLLHWLTTDAETGPNGGPFLPLPRGAGMRVAVRGMLRVGSRAGVPLEDLGVRPDHHHQLTRKDLLESNRDLLHEAAKILAGLPIYTLTAAVKSLTAGVADIETCTTNLSRLDFYLDERPWQSLDVSDGVTTLRSALPAGGPNELTLRGYADNRLVAVRRIPLPRDVPEPAGLIG